MTPPVVRVDPAGDVTPVVKRDHWQQARRIAVGLFLLIGVMLQYAVLNAVAIARAFPKPPEWLPAAFIIASLLLKVWQDVADFFNIRGVNFSPGGKSNGR